MIWIQRKVREDWHLILDMWDPDTLCGLPTGLRFECQRNPSGGRCKSCESVEKDRASNEQTASTAG